MKLHIKYMVSNRCKLLVKEELKKMGLHYIVVELGEAEIMEEITDEQREEIKIALSNWGLELIGDKKSILIEKIKTTIIEMIHHSEEVPNINFPDYLSQKLNRDPIYLANLFSEVQGITMQQFIILHKIERVKELIIYGELNFSEIAFKMNYCSVSHLSTQFKRITGLTPSHFKNLKDKKRAAIEEIGNLSGVPIDNDQNESTLDKQQKGSNNIKTVNS